MMEKLLGAYIEIMLFVIFKMLKWLAMIAFFSGALMFSGARQHGGAFKKFFIGVFCTYSLVFLFAGAPYFIFYDVPSIKKYSQTGKDSSFIKMTEGFRGDSRAKLRMLGENLNFQRIMYLTPILSFVLLMLIFGWNRNNVVSQQPYGLMKSVAYRISRLLFFPAWVNTPWNWWKYFIAGYFVLLNGFALYTAFPALRNMSIYWGFVSPQFLHLLPLWLLLVADAYLIVEAVVPEAEME